ncbi:polymorphic toxin-type HINT domain-containing protein [Kitasatospora sp. NPDC057223]|uniref:polymorphic toxin-type HINT domain-containing protein n=1 Tax=Kitasatospora sp. NPDC057223 TaxID=3346055 RepID=UPI0036351BC6
MVAALLVGSLLPALPLAASAVAAGHTKPDSPSPGRIVKVKDSGVQGRKADSTVSKPEAKHTAWPNAGTAKVTAPGSGAIKAGDLPVTLTATAPTTSGSTSAPALTPVDTDVRILPQEASRNAGITGVLLTVTGSAGPAGVSTKLAVDYSGFARAAGAGFGARLHMVQLPACVLITPEKPECRVQTPLKGGNDAEHQTVTADSVPLTAPQTPVGQLREQSASGRVTVLAATAGDAGPTGDYRATPLSAASTWSTSLNSGSFTWSYGMPLTAMPGGLTPKVGLSYDSGSIDGRTSNSNNQGSWAGDGFTIDLGSVERTYKSCSDDGAPKTDGSDPGDLCWATDNVTISFAGHSGELIPVSGDEWRIKGDDNTKVVRVRDTGRGNGDNDGEYFKATTTDGTSYYFGYNRLPNWAAGKAETKSVYTVPVFGNNSGEPCYSSGGFGSSWCQQGWRWNLDLVVDTHGNDITYWYTPETDNYGRNLKASDHTPYIRGGHLDHIEYGQQQTDLYSATVEPMAKVEFRTAERCLETAASLCDPANIDANRQYWYDTPWDQHCKDNTDCDSVSPAFFSRTRLTQVVASTLQANGTYKGVDTWDLTHKWGTADYDYQLLLDTIQHTGTATAPTVALPKTTLAYKQLVNRLDRTGDGRLPFIKQRLGTITDELGGQTDVNYSAAACSPSALPVPQSNVTRCFPQQYQPDSNTPVTTEWFNKYVVEAVIGTDRTGHAPDTVTHYTYLGDAAWHFDDLDGITKEKLKTWSQWRGYAHVKVETGGTSGMSTQAEHWFLRGMHDDRSSPTDKTQKRTVTVGDGQGTTLTDDQAWAGFEYRTEQYDRPAGKILSKTVNTPWKRTTATRTRDWGTTTANLTGTQATRTFTSLDNGAGVSWRETRTDNTFDGYGRALTAEHLGDVAVTADDQCTTSTYADNTTAWILTGTVRTETVAANCAATVDRTTRANGTSVVLSDVRVRFDGQPYGTAPVRGDATTVETLQSRTATTATYLDTVNTHDLYGRTLATTELADRTVFNLATEAGTTTALAEARTATTAYTPATGRPTRTVVTSPPAKAGDSTTARTTTTDYDLLRGQAVDTIDPNTLRTDTTYDALGRTVKVWLPNQPKANFPNTPSTEYAYTLADGQVAAVTSRTVNNDQSQDTSYALYDGFGRLRQAQAPAASGGRLITDTFYDERGQAVLVYSPYYATGAPSATLQKVEDATGVETQTRTEYDGLGRVTKATVLAGNGVGTPLASTLTEYGGDRVTVTPPTGSTPTTTITDAAGHTTELRQYKAATPTGAYDSTTYGYDPAGHMTGLRDPAGTTWTWLYDQLGRQTQAVDPDSGTGTRTYSIRGEVTSTTDGRGRTVATVYDNLSRVTETHDGSTAGPLLTSQVWDPANNKGRLASSSRFTTVAGTSYEYRTTYSLFDKLYRPTRVTFTVPSVPGQEALAGGYQINTVYNLDGTTKSVSYPAAGNLAAETVSTTYDTLHRPTAAGSGLSTYLTGRTYDYVGKPLQSTLSNGTANKQVYVTDAYEFGTQRLKSSRTDRYGVTTPARAAEYTYDQAGNVTSLTDTSASGTDRQCYRYDHLARLTEAFTPTAATCPSSPTGAALGGPAPYWTSWTYNTNGTRNTETRHDPAGNTAQDATSTYTYPVATAAQPHTLTRTGTVTGALGAPVDETYAYDLAGHTTSRKVRPSADRSSDQTLTWDAEGNLGKVSDTVRTTVGTTTTTTLNTTDYLYDATGGRLLTHNLDTAGPAAESWTLYLGGTELKLTKGAAKPAATRYYPLGVATGVRADDSTLTFQVNDHHGTAEIGINAATGAVDQRRTTPFGAVRGTAPTGWAGTRGFLGGTTEPTALTHLGARDYDPATGRFVSVDPVILPTDPQSLNAYIYSNNNPLTVSDPSGTCPRDLCDGYGQNPGGLPGIHGSYEDADEPDRDTENMKPGQTQVDNDLYIPVTFSNPTKFMEAYYANRHRIVSKYSPDPPITSQLWLAVDICEMVKGACSRDELILLRMLQGISLLIVSMTIGAEGPGSFGAMSPIGDVAAFKRMMEVSASGPAKLPGNSELYLGGGGSCSSKNSFPEGTLVLKSDGSAVAIDELQIGDEVLSTDPETGETGPRRVDATIMTSDDRQFTTLTVKAADGTTISLSSTDHHPFWSENRHRWLDAVDLSPGDSLRTSSTSKVTVTDSVPWTGLQAAFNLTVRDLHTYYVLAGGTPVLVHNSTCPRVIGNNPDYQKVAAAEGAQYFEVPMEQWNKLTPEEQWGANQRFLDRGIKEGAIFRLGTPIDEMKMNSVYVREVNYLLSNGYTFNKAGDALVSGR